MQEHTDHHEIGEGISASLALQWPDQRQPAGIPSSIKIASS